MSDRNSYRSVNLSDQRQDVHKQRSHPPNLPRYDTAERLLPEGSEDLLVLELGGGIGEFSRRMLRRGIKVTFADLSDHNVAKARNLGLETLKLDLNLGLPGVADRRFDGVVILEVIEHLIAVELVLAEIARVLKPGGFLILSTPNFAFFQNRMRILLGKLSMDEGYHYRFFTPRVLKQRLENAGFRIERSAHTMPAFGYNFLFNRLLGRRRRHVRIPTWLAPLFAHTLFLRARKK